MVDSNATGREWKCIGLLVLPCVLLAVPVIGVLMYGQAFKASRDDFPNRYREAMPFIDATYSYYRIRKEWPTQQEIHAQPRLAVPTEWQ